MENLKFIIGYGALCDKPSEQLKEQNITIDKNKASKVDKMAEALLILKFGGVLTDSQCDKIRNKINKFIAKAIVSYNRTMAISSGIKKYGTKNLLS